jgi:hypothetical protein
MVLISVYVYISIKYSYELYGLTVISKQFYKKKYVFNQFIFFKLSAILDHFYIYFIYNQLFLFFFFNRITFVFPLFN